MDYSKFFLSSIESGPAPDPLEGHPINQSLRFRGSSYLSRNFTVSGDRRVWTCSFWAKVAKRDSNDNKVPFLGNTTSNDNDNYAKICLTSSTQRPYFGDYSRGGNSKKNACRDSSGWYHFVYVLNTREANAADRLKVYVNGVEAEENSSAVIQDETYAINKAAVHNIGMENSAGSPFSFLDGNLAEYIFIDGQALDCTAFGTFNSAGVWVPIEIDWARSNQPKYSDYLYTAANDGQTYSTTLEKNFHASFPATMAFDGVLAQGAGVNMAGTATGGVWMVYEPPTPIEVTKVEVWTRNYQVGGSGGGKYSVNRGNSINFPAFSNNFEWFDIGLSGTLTSFGVQDNTNSVTYVGGIRITTTAGAEILVDPFLWSQYLSTNNAGGFQEPASNAFNGSTSDPACMSGNTGGTLTWAPTQFEFKSKIEVYCKAGLTSPNYIAAWNGNEVNYVHNTWVTVYEGSGIISDIRPLTITADPSDQAALAAVRIDGKLVVDGVNSSFGQTGFYLDFSDPNDIGADRSGNENHWTPTNFDLNIVPATGFYVNDGVTTYDQASGTVPNGGTPYVIDVSSGDGSFCAQGFAPDMGAAMFNGDITTELSSSYLHAGSGAWMNEFTIDLRDFTADGVADVKIYAGFNQADTADSGWSAQLLDSSKNAIGGSTVTLPRTTLTVTEVNVPVSGSPAYIRIFKTSDSAYTSIYGYRINGTLMSQRNIATTDYDFSDDTPTKNHSVLNPLVPGQQTLTNANLKANYTTVNATASGTIAVKGSGKYYWEVKVVAFTTYHVVGIGSPSMTSWVPAGPSIVWCSITGSPTQIIQFFGDFTASNSTVTTPYDNGDIVGWALDLDNNRCEVFQNGVSRGTFDIDVGDQWVAPIVGNSNADPSGHYDYINFGQAPFSFTPPEGFVSLQTQNLPKPAITDGGDHFRVLTGPGASILSIAQGQLNGDNGAGFQRGLWWIKDQTGDNQHQFVDSVRGGNLAVTCPNSDPNIDYVAPTGDSVAWCWNYNAEDPTVNGFEIIEDLNGAGTRTIPHNLGVEPDMIFAKCTSSGRGWTVFHSSLTPGNNLQLNTTSAQTQDVERVSAVTATNFEWTTPEASDDNEIFYLWNSIPGYSDFGVYNGNGDADGWYVHTGFEPAFLMIKNITTASDWRIVDTARSICNPTELGLFPNKSLENPADGMQIDILSNGFKLRSSAEKVNNAGYNYIYAAFASVPTGGKGTAPATASLSGPRQYDAVLPGIANSLRFRGAQQLRGTSYRGTTTSATFSFWLKIAAGDADKMFIHGMQSGAANGGGDLYRRELATFNNKFDMASDAASTLNSLGGYRDPGAWYHITYNFSPSGPQYWFNGVRDDDGVTTAMSIVQNDGAGLNKIVIGNNGAGSSPDYLKGYLADFHYVDGQALPPTEFGQYVDGTWRPKDVDVSDYGTNGFHLVFDPAYVVGDTLRDQSGKGNDFTMMGFELGDFYSPNFDFMKDGPTVNYTTLNPLYTNGTTGPGTLSAGNLGYTAYVAPGYKVCPGTQSIKDGAYYWEYYPGNVNNSYPAQVGILRGTNPAETTRIGWDTNGNVFGFSLQYNGQLTGDSNGEGSSTEEVIEYIPTGFVDGDVIGMYCDIPNNYVGWYKNGVLHCEVTNVNSEYEWMPALSQFYDNPSNFINFGQQPFRYPLPAGYQPLNSNTAAVDPIADGKEHFRALTYTGDSAVSRSITDLDFQPDLVWIKRRDAVENHALYDSVRGVQERLQCNTTDGESTQSNAVSSFDANGWTMGSDSQINFSGGTYVAWSWKAGDAAVANTDGDIASQVSTNTDAGFSIITYSGNNAATASIGHGLNSEPEFVIVKARNDSKYWTVYHASISKGTYNTLELNTTGAMNVQPDNEWFGVTQDFNDTIFTVGLAGGPSASNSANTSGLDYVAYAWHSVPGFSSIGKYNGNGNVDGPFINCGFRPAFVLIKSSTNSSEYSSWSIYDSSRFTNNPTINPLYANSNNLEGQRSNGDPVNAGTSDVDFLSNGFKLRNDFTETNRNGDTYVYLAFAENPYNISNAR